MSQNGPPSIEDWIVSVVRARLDTASEEDIRRIMEEMGPNTEEQIKDLIREVLVEEAVVGYGGELGLHTIENEPDSQTEAAEPEDRTEVPTE